MSASKSVPFRIFNYTTEYFLNYPTIDIVDEDGRGEIILIVENFYYIIWYKKQRIVEPTPSLKTRTGNL